MVEAADAAFRHREPQRAIALWDAVRQIDPFDQIATANRAVAMLRLGLAYVEADVPEKAIPFWEEVRRGEAFDGYAAYNLALLSARLGRQGEAAKYADALRIAWDVPKEIEPELLDMPLKEMIRRSRGYVAGSAGYRKPRRDALVKVEHRFGDSWWLDALFPGFQTEERWKRRGRRPRSSLAANRR